MSCASCAPILPEMLLYVLPIALSEWWALVLCDALTYATSGICIAPLFGTLILRAAFESALSIRSRLFLQEAEHLQLSH